MMTETERLFAEFCQMFHYDPTNPHAADVFTEWLDYEDEDRLA